MSAQKRLDTVKSQIGAKEDEFVFTLNTNNKLTTEQRRFYEENGFLLVRGLVPEKDCDTYISHFVDLCDGKKKVQPNMTLMRDVLLKDNKESRSAEQNITKIQNFQDDPVLFSYCQHPAVLEYAEAIAGPDLKAMHTMLINKPTDLGQGSSRHPPHQDLWYFPFRPAERIVASWTALQHIDMVNGCLVVTPGSHKGKLFLHEYPKDGVVNKAYHGIQGMSSEEATRSMTPMVMEKGDTLFFHPLVIHGSGRNNSPFYRKAISCHYANTVECFWYEDPTQDMVADEIMEISKQMMKKKGKDVINVSINWIDVWRYKSRLVRGREGQLQ